MALMVAHPAAYPWSSDHWHAGGTADPLPTDHALYQRLGHTAAERQATYRARCETEMAPPVLEGLDCMAFLKQRVTLERAQTHTHL